MEKAKTSSICQEPQFDQVYKDQVKGLYHFIYYKCGDKALAEDLVQEAFLKLWENCSKIQPAQAKAFLYTTIKNLFLNKVDKKKVVLKFIRQLVRSNDQESPEFLLEQKEFQERLYQAIHQLPENQREVFLMNRIEKLKYREIAERLGISQKAVEKRMHKALLTMRDLHKKI